MPHPLEVGRSFWPLIVVSIWTIVVSGADGSGCGEASRGSEGSLGRATDGRSGEDDGVVAPHDDIKRADVSL
jgi:hypothetical protein